MERTKTLQQLQQQKRRMSQQAQGVKRKFAIAKIYVRYYTNIINHFNVMTEFQYGEIYNKPVPVSVYAKQTEKYNDR